MSRPIVFGLFFILAAVQIAVPASMIAKREAALQEGRLFKFRVAPVDPYDAFRGRYVALSLKEDSGPPAPGSSWVAGQTAYAELSEDSEGFAHIRAVTPWTPDHPDYITAQVRYAHADRVYLELPVDRYYMGEDVAPRAEIAYREHARAGVEDAYVAVRVRDGMAVIEGLYLAGMPIEEYLKLTPAEDSAQ